MQTAAVARPHLLHIRSSFFLLCPMVSNSSPDYKALFLRAEEGRKQAELRQKQAEDREEQAEEGRRQERKRNQRTTFTEFIRYCHNLLSRPLEVETPSLSTTGNIPLPTGKYCPTRLRPWEDCPTRQQEVYNSVCHYLRPVNEGSSRLFSPLLVIEDHARRFRLRPISSEQGLETYERIAVEDHVRDIIAELCKLPEAREEFGLGNGVWFDNHTNALDEGDISETVANQPSSSRHPRPDQFCIHRVDGETNTLLTTVEYKPPHKLSVENLRVGLRPMELWEEVANRDTIPTDKAAKLQYNAEYLVCSTLVQEYHVMIQEGLEYSNVTNGLARVLLHVPYDNPSTLYYYFCDPNREVNGEDKQSFQRPQTSIARVLCLCLMSFRSRQRDQGWRNSVRSQLHTWKTSFDHTRSQIPNEELKQNPAGSEHSNSEPSTPEHTSSEYQMSSSPLESPTAKGRQMTTRSQASCAPDDTISHAQSDSSDSDSHEAAPGRKRGFSKVTSSPPIQRQPRHTYDGDKRSGRHREHNAQFCTQRCLLSLRQGANLDEHCPNVKLHRHGQHGTRHPITTETLVEMLKRQLDENLDCNCTPFGVCGAYGAPFKLTCTTYGYTVVGKGTSTQRWNTVSREADVYQVLRQVQGSAVPVFLGKIDLAKVYFLHGAGEIRHMLVMAWGGESIAKLGQRMELRREVSRSKKEIRALGVVHQDLRPENILWNDELGRALIIDFHRSILDKRPKSKRSVSLKRPACEPQPREGKRLRVENYLKQSYC